MDLRQVLSPRQAQAQHPLANPPRPTAQAYSTPARPPSEYLIEAQGDVTEAARLANTPIPDFMRALGSDTSVPQVVQSVLFLAILDNLRMLNVSGAYIRERLETARTQAQAQAQTAATSVRATAPASYDPRDNDPLAHIDDPEPEEPTYEAPEYDPLTGPPSPAPAPDASMKDLIKLYQGASNFIASAAASHAPRPAIPGRHTAPSQRTQVLEAMRTRPQQPQLETPTVDLDLDDDEETLVADDLAARLANAPDSIKRILRGAALRAGLGDPELADAE